MRVADRPVQTIRLEGLQQTPEQLVRNQIRIEPGDPFDPEVVQRDLVRLTHLNRFESVRARLEPTPEGGLALVYVFQEQPLLADVQVVGNKNLNDQELLEVAVLRPGDPVDEFLIQRGANRIEALYQREGYFLSSVEVDEKLLNKSGILIYRVREGPRVRIRDIRFEGNETFRDGVLKKEVQSSDYFPIISPGALSREQLERDTASIRDYYRNRGYLDAQVGRRIDLSEDQKSAIVTFVIDEGARYTVDRIEIEGNAVFPTAQILRTIPLKSGDVYSQRRQRDSVRSLRQMYGRLGYIDTQVQIDRLFHENEPQVDVLVRIREGKPHRVGKVTVRGNRLTQQKVILRQLRGMNPGRRFDRTGIDLTERRLSESPLFSEGEITILGDEEDVFRDVLVEVDERRTGSVAFGASVSSDAGLLGAISLTQRNFDIADPPDSFGEFITGRAFRGAGQFFRLNLQPGTERSLYQVTFREPNLFDTALFFDTDLFFFQREREDYDERRLGVIFGIGQRFGDVWSASLRPRFERVDIGDIDDDAPLDAFAVEGDTTVTGLRLQVTRDTTNSRIFPTEGNKLQASVERVGVFGGDFDFTTLGFEASQFYTVREDAFERKTVLSVNMRVAYIIEPNDAPLFERFYAGGHRSFRGFTFRGAGPRGIKANTGREGEDPVGGDFLFLFRVEYNYPLVGETLRGVFFMDTGTVERNVTFENYRVSVGAGIRLKVPFIGDAPFALDLGVPVVRQDFDEERILSFDFALPF